ncbi:hypothetical protein V5799_032392 [Amblyomma americanum]|uniref:RING-CH-type domain-containing protein n=1 Tax=Amblyomma americanum TaxID=6943 RepID=A0AAQ4DRB0_AMBAM
MSDRARTAATSTPRESTPILGRVERRDQTPCADSFSASPECRVHVPKAYREPGDEEEDVPLSPAPTNVTTSSGPICRICHEGDHGLPLLSICLCSGTMGLVHLFCLEHWLSASGSETCEICHYRFNVERQPRRFCEWLRSASVRRGLLGDVMCFGLLSPLAFLCGVLCLHGAAQQMLQQRLWESIGLTTLAFLLFTVYSAWAVLTFRYHYRSWRKWREANPYVKVVDAPRQFQDLPENAGKKTEVTVPHVAVRLPLAGRSALPSGSGLDSSFELYSPNTVASGSTAWEYCTSRL